MSCIVHELAVQRGWCACSGELGCGHYKRKCKVVAPCCDRAYTCRECHDEAEPDHEMDSKAVESMVCMECNTRQHAARASRIRSLTAPLPASLIC